MKSLKDILYKVPIVEVRGDTSVPVSDFFFDSRQVDFDSVFVAVRGTVTDGHDYIQKALESGALAIVCEEIPANEDKGTTWIKVSDSAEALAIMAANFYGNPAEELKVVGVTGTNGKTTTTTLLHHAFNQLGIWSGLFSTVSVKIGKEEIAATHTTPDPKTLHSTFRRMLDEGCEYCFMEVSSHALVQKRTKGIPFRAAIFTNITRDHLDYHQTFDEYIRAKKILFDELPKDAVAIMNKDDRNSAVMVQNSKARVTWYSLQKMADYRAKILENTFEGLQLDLDGKEVWFRMIGSFNAYNLLATVATATELGLDQDEFLLELSAIPGVSGRFEAIYNHDRTKVAVVDYAHTPDALKNVLHTINDIRNDNGKVITVVGCGGNRDKGKRPEMGRIAAELSSLVILTSDNPRNEDPDVIIREMEAGVPVSLRSRVMTITQRREAIAAACRMAAADDVILVAGKGHETYQEINGKRHFFDDREVVRETFNKIAG